MYNLWHKAEIKYQKERRKAKNKTKSTHTENLSTKKVQVNKVNDKN